MPFMSARYTSPSTTAAVEMERPILSYCQTRPVSVISPFSAGLMQ